MERNNPIAVLIREWEVILLSGFSKIADSEQVNYPEPVGIAATTALAS